MPTIPFSRRNAKSNPPVPELPLPHNFDAERSVLGAVLLDNACLKVVSEILHTGDFFDGRHRAIFSRMLDMASRGLAIDLVTLLDNLPECTDLDTKERAAYVASLTDGQPRVANIAHYAAIIKEKSLRRGFINQLALMQQIAEEDRTPYGDLRQTLDTYIKENEGAKRAGLVSVGIREFIDMNLAPVDFIIEPLLPLRGTGMVYSKRGAGKTFTMLHIAYSVAGGAPDCFVWKVPRQRRVVYIDGEMDARSLQERYQGIALMDDRPVPEDSQLRIITPDLQTNAIPKINTPIGQAQIEEQVQSGDLLILDNLGALSPSSDEKETEDWAIIQEWFLKLRRGNVGVIFVHHAGKGGDQRGTSKREDLVNFVLKLSVPADYNKNEGLRAELELTKLRQKAEHEKYAEPFEVSLIPGEKLNTIAWAVRPLTGVLRERARRMLLDGMREHDVAADTNLSRWTVRRIQKRIKEGPADVDGTPYTDK
jgi:putative DNA primase/helicase